MDTGDRINGAEYLPSQNDIAIIGMAIRFPRSNRLERFWEHLRAGRELISVFSDEELASAGVTRAQFQQPHYVRARAILEDIDLFDAAFFGFNPREAEATDPQHRLFLECAWEALEQAGYDPLSYPGAIGVYAGSGTATYLLNNVYQNPAFLESLDAFQVQICNEKDYLTTLVSYRLNLKGPSVAVQTACSTSLVAIHLACQSILSGECEMALAGGVTISCPQKQGYLYQENGIASPDGHCRAFDARAQGTVGGSGAGVVVLKSLQEALADGDYIHAVMKGSAINNDGMRKAGYTAPSVDGQASVITEALSMAGVEPTTISYVETHGTATPLGDPIEIAGLTQAFRNGSEADGPCGFCAIGSVKTNLGHLDTAAGVAGIIKTVLALQHKQIPPSLHFERPNPQIDFANSPFYVNRQLAPWKTGTTPRRAGVSSFGIGGTNAHVILQEAPPYTASEEAPGSIHPLHLLVLSARTGTALENCCRNLATHLKQHAEHALADIAYTLQVGRHAFDQRAFLLCQDRDEAIEALEGLDARRIQTGSAATDTRPVVLLFPGLGAHYVSMGQELYVHEALFRAEVDRCAELLKPQLGLDVRSLLYPAQEKLAEAIELLEQSAFAMPALFVIEYALARLWMAWGIRPQALIGHSLGEYTAACIAGVFSLQDALALVALRGRLYVELPPGAMLSVALSEEELLPRLNAQLSLASVNAPALCSISGTQEAIEQFARMLEQDGIAFQRVAMNVATHSNQVTPVLSRLRTFIAQLSLQAPRIPYISSLTGTWITAEEATSADYWARQARQPVRFHHGVRTILEQEPESIMLETGPQRTLGALVKMARVGKPLVLSSLRHAHNAASDLALLHTTLGRLWLAGVQPDWSRYAHAPDRRRLPLPTYPFERQRYWVEPQPSAQQGANGKLGPADRFFVPLWKQTLLRAFTPTEDEASAPWLVLADNGGFGARLVARLKVQGRQVIVVARGSAFTQLDEQSYILNPAQQEDYSQLCKALRRIGSLPTNVLHLWTLTTDGTDDSPEELLDSGFYSLIFLAQAYGDFQPERSLRLTVVGNGLQNVLGDEIIQPAKATVLGPCRVIPQEYPGWQCRCIDIRLPPPESPQEAELFTFLLRESATPSSEAPDIVCAYRGGRRWEPTLEALSLPESSGEGTLLRQRGVYLITGGLGGIGLELASYLAESVQARLILLGRSPLPPRAEWEDWLDTHPAQDRVSQKIRKLRACEQAGAEVLIIQADVTDRAQGSEVCEQIVRRFGRLDGVIHAAGNAGGGLIQLKTPADAAMHLAPKVQGTLNLEALCRRLQPRFLLLCSSLNTLYGGEGLVDYCAGNAFLDAFAEYHHVTHGTRIIAIAWATWQNTGMAAGENLPGDIRHRLAISGAQGLTPMEGINAFERILASGHKLPRILVAMHDLRTPLPQFVATEGAQSASVAEATQKREHLYPRPLALQNSYTPPRNEVEEQIATMWQEILGIERIGVHDNFFELGGHSLLATRLLARLRAQFQTELPLRVLFEAPTIAELGQKVTHLQEVAQSAQLHSKIARPPLVSIQTRGERLPLFCVHPAGGTVLCYSDLARYLGQDQPVYGLEADGTDRAPGTHSSMEAMASDYIEAIRRFRPEGPYLLAGYSSGGIVAFEMAQQLQRQGQKIGLLAVIDKWARVPVNYQEDPAQHLADVVTSWFGEGIPYSLEHMHQITQDEQMVYLLRQARKVGKMPADLDVAQALSHLRTYTINDQAAQAYRARPYPGRVTLLRADIQPEGAPSDPTMGWGELAQGGVEVLPVSGNHKTVLEEPYVREVARHLTNCLNMVHA